MNNVKSKATTTEFQGGFSAGVGRTPTPAASGKLTSGYKTSPSEPTAVPIQKGQTDRHYNKDAAGFKTIPASKTVALQPGT